MLEKDRIRLHAFLCLAILIYGVWSWTRPWTMIQPHQKITSASEVRVYPEYGMFEGKLLVHLRGQPVEDAVAATRVAGSNACEMGGNNHMDGSDTHRVEFWQGKRKLQDIYIHENDGEVYADSDEKRFGVKPGCQQYLTDDARLYWQNLLHQARLELKTKSNTR